MNTLDATLQKDIEKIVIRDIELEHRKASVSPSPFWQGLKNCGTELWLDTGDIDDALSNWSAEMSGLTTNNTLLNKEIQKGIYDSFIEQSGKPLKDLDIKDQIREIAFILNARHGLVISRIFGCKVSVELHTDLAHDLDGIVDYGRRFYSINPGHFIIKVPYTPTGLLGARKLHEAGIPVNFTLGFSARQNLLATLVARPNYVNVFLGRIGAYMKNNNLSDGKYFGEKTTLETQKIVKKYAIYNTRLIAASIRSADQLDLLAGNDVITIPVKIAGEAVKTLMGNFTPKTVESFLVTYAASADPQSLHTEKLWEISDDELKFALELDKDPPSDATELVERASASGCGDMFPTLTADELSTISDDGKIPVHGRWARSISQGKTAIDTLLNLAGLASFTSDQKELDTRIEGIIG